MRACDRWHPDDYCFSGKTISLRSQGFAWSPPEWLCPRHYKLATQ